jgi:alcohol/geraniol dehydrogenase (NADP+)
MSIDCLAAHAAKEPLRPYRYEPGELGPGDVELKITHCGICHSDLHLINDDWGLSKYPLVPGHEIIGHVSALGPSVKSLKIGQRVGVGWEASSCLECEYCLRGEENFCAQNQGTCVGRPGGYADRIRVHSHFAFPIPEVIESEAAGPLLCGGITVFTPLRAFEVSPLMRVGVIGIGGLGHLALQFARAFGCEVTAFSSTPGKEAEAKKFGAHHFAASTDTAAMASLGGSFDFLLSTVNVDLDWSAYLGLLRPKGKLCLVGASQAPLNISAFALLVGQKTVCGSNIGGSVMIREMLEFAARHGIRPQVELRPMAEANAALARLAANQARYRMVLVN